MTSIAPLGIVSVLLARYLRWIEWEYTEATTRRASFSVGGKFRPLRSARRIIPAHAFALKKYFDGTLDISKDSDKKDTAAALGCSEELRVKHTP